MLTQLHIKNVAVIDEIDLDIKPGLNVLTGETGAGKSIIINSINMILGERGGRELVRHGQTNAIIQAAFEDAGNKALSFAQEYDAAENEDDVLVLSRRISDNGKSTCRLNSSVVPSSALRDIGALLVNIHGQHDNQRLLSAQHHIEFLDSFGTEQIQGAKETYEEIYEEYVQLSKRLDSLVNNEAERLERIDFLSFRCDELEKAELCIGEEEQLEREETLLANAEEVIKSLADSYNVLYEGEFTAYDALSAASSALLCVADYDDELKKVSEELSETVYKVNDIASQIRQRRDSFDFDPARLSQIQERLSLISSLKRKYNTDEKGLIELGEKMREELDTLCSGTENASDVKAKLDECEKNLKQAAKKLTLARTKAKLLFENLVTQELCDLDMEKVQFSVNLDKTETYTKSGCDKIEFLISTNPGEPLKPLSKIASGGELSRIMLALKTVLADKDDVQTLIFDEIDTGVSGRAASKIASKLCKIAKHRQVICITHLAQIACAADHHYLIKKEVGENSSSTNITLLDENQRIEELARIMGAVEITDTTRAHASELRREAIKMKLQME